MYNSENICSYRISLDEEDLLHTPHLYGFAKRKGLSSEAFFMPITPRYSRMVMVISNDWQTVFVFVKIY